MLTIEVNKKDFNDLVRLCEKASRDKVVGGFRHHTDLYKNVSIELRNKDGDLLFCCSDQVTVDFIKEAKSIIDKQYLLYKPTFDDLIDIVVQAMKDGILQTINITNTVGVDFVVEENPSEVLGFGIDEAGAGINFIKDLYTETFVIDSMQFPDLKVGGKFVQNGFEWELDEEKVKIIENTPFFLLKGATVTQNRGEK